MEFPAKITCTDGEPWTVWSWSDIYEDVRDTVRDYVSENASLYTDDPYPGVDIPESYYTDLDNDYSQVQSDMEEAWLSWVEPTVDRLMADLWASYDEADPMSWKFTVGDNPHHVSFWFVKEK